jgi:hypothetical protein
VLYVKPQIAIQFVIFFVGEYDFHPFAQGLLQFGKILPRWPEINRAVFEHLVKVND